MSAPAQGRHGEREDRSVFADERNPAPAAPPRKPQARRDPRNGQIRYVRMWISDFIADTHLLSHTAAGVYIRLFWAAVSAQEHVADDPAYIVKLIAITQKDWTRYREELIDFGVLELIDGRLYDRRAQKAIDEFRKASNRNKGNVESRYATPAKDVHLKDAAS